MRHEVKVFPMKYQKPVKVYEAFIELNEDHFFYKADFSAMEPIDQEDASMGEEKVMNSFERKLLRSHVTGVDITYLQKSKFNQNVDSMWKITIYCYAADDTKIYYEKKEDVFKVFNEIFEWIKK